MPALYSALAVAIAAMAALPTSTDAAKVMAEAGIVANGWQLLGQGENIVMLVRPIDKAGALIKVWLRYETSRRFSISDICPV